MRLAASRSGFTLIEALIVMVLLSTVALALIGVLQVGRKATQSTTTQLDLDAKIRDVLARISEELRTASRLAEDTNDNDNLDEGEDTNDNSRLEHDWKVTANSVTFNRLLPSGLFALPITYRLVGDVLERVEMQTPEEDEVLVAITRYVTAFTVDDDGSRVKLTLGLLIPSPTGVAAKRTQSIVIALRN